MTSTILTRETASIPARGATAAGTPENTGQTHPVAVSRVENPPPKNPRGVRHSARLAAEACEMYGDGDAWQPSDIRRHFEARGIKVSDNTIRRWVVPGFDRKDRLRRAARYAERGELLAQAEPATEGEPIDLDRRMIELRARGLTYPAIAVVVEVYHGTPIDAEAVRYRLRKHGVAPVAQKSAVMRRLHAAPESPWKSPRQGEAA